MLSFNNERIIQQGEEWNLDLIVSQSSKEYIPFIISSERREPMWAITVSSTKFDKNNRYVKTWWLSLEYLPRFYQTVPHPIGEIRPYQPIIKPHDHPPMHALYQYTKSQDSIDLNLGHKPYYYVYFELDHGIVTPKFDYECRIRMTFESEDTSLWESQNYMYQVTLVDTVSMLDVVAEAKTKFPELNWPMSSDVEVLFPFIKEKLPNWFQVDIDVDSPVGLIDIPQVILPPTKLQVNSNLRKII